MLVHVALEGLSNHCACVELKLLMKKLPHKHLS